MPAQVLSGPFYYSGSTADSRNNSTLLFQFNTNISTNQGKVSIEFSANNTTSVSLRNDPQEYSINNEFLYVSPFNKSNYANSSLPKIDHVSVDGIKSTTSDSQFSTGYNSTIRVGKMVYGSGKYTISNGANVGVRMDRQDEFNLSKPNGEVVDKLEFTGLGDIQKLSTDRLETGNYTLESKSGIKNISLRLIDSSLSLEAMNTVTGSEIPIRVEAAGNNRSAVLRVSNEVSSEVYREEVMLSSVSNLTRSIPVSHSGTYLVEVSDLNTNMTATQEVNISKNRNPTVTASSNNSLADGNLLEFMINSTYTHSSVSLFDSDNNTTATIELTTSDTGPTPVTINTYASPESPSDFVTTGPGVDVESVTGSVDSLSPGTYELTLRSEHGTAVANDTATVTVNSRSTTDLTAYTTNTVEPDGFDDASAVREAIADGTLTEATTATANDTVVYAVNATGLTGLPAAANASLERGTDLDRLDGLSFGVGPTNASETNDTDEDGELGPMPNGSAIHLDRDGLFVVADGETAFGTETPPETGETFEAEFRVTDETLRRAAADDRHRVTTRLTVGAVDPVGGYTDNETANGSTVVSATDNETDDGATTVSASGNETANASNTVSASGNETGDVSSAASTSKNETDAGPATISTTGNETSAGSTTPVRTNELTAGSVSTGPKSTDSSDPQAGLGATGGAADEATGDTAPAGSAVGGAATGGPGTSTNVDNATDTGGPDASGGPLDSAANRSAPPREIGVGADATGIPAAAGPPAVVTGGVALGTDRSAVDRSVTPGDGADGGEEGDAAGATDSGDESTESTESPAAGGPPPDESSASDLGYDDAPIRSTVYDLPGFDPLASLAALAGASLLARRRAIGR